MPKKIIILSIGVIILGALVFIFESPFEDRFGTEEGPFYPDLHADEIAAIEIEYFVQGTRFEKDEKGVWWFKAIKSELQKKIESEEAIKEDKRNDISDVKYPADPDKVNNVITTLMKLKKGAIFSNNPEKQGILQITPMGLNVTLIDKKGKKMERLFVGKEGPDIFSSFVKDENSNEVYLVEGNLQGVFNRSMEDWKK